MHTILCIGFRVWERFSFKHNSRSMFFSAKRKTKKEKSEKPNGSQFDKVSKLRCTIDDSRLHVERLPIRCSCWIFGYKGLLTKYHILTELCRKAGLPLEIMREFLTFLWFAYRNLLGDPIRSFGRARSESRIGNQQREHRTEVQSPSTAMWINTLWLPWPVTRKKKEN